MKQILIFLLLTVSAYAGTYSRVKTKLENYIQTQGYTYAQIKTITKPQMETWLNANYPKANIRVVWAALQEIIYEADKQRIQSFLTNIVNTIKTYYPDATATFDAKSGSINITLTPREEL